ncbi:unnamed protein product [Ascophyllum nodosum]
MPEFHFMESDWGTHAMRGGKITTAAALVIMVLSFIFFSVWQGFVALGIALLLATFELPVLYTWIQPCRQLNDLLNETLRFNMPAVRAVLYACLSALSFWSGKLNIGLGILLVLTGLLYVFAQIVGASLTDTSNIPSGDQTPGDGQTPFGTFA